MEVRELGPLGLRGSARAHRMGMSTAYGPRE
jgi:hypothetical protein